MNIGDVFLRVLADTKDFRPSVVKEATATGAQAGTVMGKGMTANIKKAFGGPALKQGIMQGLGLGAGLTGVGLLTAGIGGLTQAIGDSITAASNQREALSLSAQVFEGQAGAMEEWAGEASRAFGTSKTDAMNFASGFGTAFKNVGFALDETAEKSQTMTRLAADLGSAFNASSEEAAVALRSGLLGEAEPMRRFGVFLSETAVQAKAAEMGLVGVGGELSNQQKVLARYQIIMEQTRDSQGMFGRDSESLADTQKSLEASLADVSAEIGEALLPVMRDLVGWVQDNVVPGLTEFADALGRTREEAALAKGPVQDLVNVLHDVFKAPEADAHGPLGETVDLLNDIQQGFTDAGIGVHEFFTPWERGAREAAKRNDELGVASLQAANHANTMREAAILTTASTLDMAASGKRATSSLDDLGDEGSATFEILSKGAKDAAGWFEDYRDRVIGAARDVVDKAYQVLEDKSELTATNIEMDELRKTIATGKATKEQKARYRELGKQQAELVLSLAANGAEASREVSTALTQMRKRLTTATGNERRAILATIRALENLVAATRRANAHLATLRANSNIGKVGTYANSEYRAAGGPVTAGQPYIVGEHRPELFVPETDGMIYRTVAEGWDAVGGDQAPTTYNIPVTFQGAAPAAMTPGELALEMRRLGEMNLLPSLTRSPRYRARAGT